MSVDAGPPRWWQREKLAGVSRSEEWGNAVRKANEQEAVRDSMREAAARDRRDSTQSPTVGAHDAIRMLPAGNRYHFLSIALTKRMLRDDTRLTTADRLAWLERLTNDEVLSPEQIAAIEPLDDTGTQMLLAAMSLDEQKEKPPLKASFNLVTSGDLFLLFVQLNPSLLAAAKMTTRRATVKQ
jgi:hypothetical protein